ncbi:MAG: L-arabinose isomerase [Spirochaetales bacterium]|nr:L-arabinose isomerase [Spirochaetales bacterium]
MDRSVFDRYQVWFVTGSQHLYGPETLKQVATDAKKIVAGLNAGKSLAVELIWKETLTTREEINRLMREASADHRCIGLVTWMHTFSPAKMWITGLSELSKPFCQLHTQSNREIPWDTIDMDFMNLNQTAHGGREFGFIGSRLRLERKVIVGYWEEKDVQARLDAWMRAAAAFADGREMKLARFGDNMREVAVTEGDKVEAQKVFGYAVHGYGLGELAGYTSAATDGEIDALVKEYEKLYVMGKGLESGKGRERVRTGARLEIGMRRFLEEGGFKAFTTTFENLHGLDQLPGLACQRLMADGYGFGAEGDWKTAALVRAMKVMGAGLPGGCTFMEDYTYHLVPGRSLVLGAHMLEICPSIAKGHIRLEAQPLAIGGKDDPARLIFESSLGPAINVSLMDMGNRFRFVLNEVEAVAPPAQLPKLPVARVVWKPKPDLATAAASWIYAGGAHHTGYSRAITREHIVDYASMAGVELLCIGEGSTVEGIRNEIRWNEMYYHLARGI